VPKKKAEREVRLRREWEQLKLSKYQGINLYIKNIEDEVDEERLRREFAVFGQIKSCKIMTDERNNARGFGFVCFTTPEEAIKAITDMNNRILTGCAKPLYVALHEPKEIRRQKLAQRHNALSGGGRGVQQPIYPGSQVGSVYYPNNPIMNYSQQMMAQMQPRGWHNQPPPGSYPSLGMMPRGGNTRAGGNAGGASGGSRNASNRAGTGRSNGHANTNNSRQRNQPSQIHDMNSQGDLTLQHLQVQNPETQKLLLGESLYPLIQASQPQLAGKITGMFLDSGWAPEELFSLVNDSEKLSQKIEDAIGVLDRAQPKTEDGIKGVITNQ